MAYTNDQIQQIVDWFFNEGTRQYIGSRYVPTFADPIQHSSTRTYEPLTIVQHQGNSYTSKQYVPTGIAVTDERYWALTGNYNAQVEQYRQEVQTYDGRITQNADDIQELSDNLTLNGKKLLVIGDSFSDDSRITNHWHKYVCDYFGITLANYAVGGAGFCATGSTGTSPTFIQQLNNAYNDGLRDDDIAFIVVFGGANDWFNHFTYQDVRTAIGAFRTRLQTLFPNSFNKTYILFGNTGYMLQNGYAGFMTWYEAIQSYIEGSIKYRAVRGVPFWTNYNGNAFFTFDDDLTHPGDYGQSFIGGQVIRVMTGTYNNINKVIFANSSGKTISDSDGNTMTYTGFVYWVDGVLHGTLRFTNVTWAQGWHSIGGSGIANFPCINEMKDIYLAPISNIAPTGDYVIINSEGRLGYYAVAARTNTAFFLQF